MKILGSQGRGYICVLSEDEVARVSGISYADESLRSRLRPGSEVQVSEAWCDLAKFREASKKIKNASAELHSLAAQATLLATEYVIAPPPENPAQ